MPNASDISDILKAAVALLASLAVAAGTIIGWAGIAARFGERRAKLKAELDKKASRDELSAVRDSLQNKIRVSRDESRAENMEQLKLVLQLDSAVKALHKRVDANVAALEAQGQDLKANTEATLRTEAATEATREMLQMVLDRMPGKTEST